MSPVVPGGVSHLPVGTVIEQRQGSRTVLLVQETPQTTSVIETWEDGFDVANRLLRRLDGTLEDMNADMSAFNERMTKGLQETAAKIEANQHLLDELIKSRS